MLDVGNLTVEDEIAFAIGKPIRLHITTELRIMQALAKYHGAQIPPVFTASHWRFATARPRLGRQPAPRRRPKPFERKRETTR